ncbi:hypothetical protein [Mycobacteroides abscessus]|uniref:hypothetical protein n=1 Tax=Mycobacteroides abscessus TaxID=36809 RepID=UPI0009A6438B|nr:hypothetical protein [Mycobacteroides abscessus]SLH41571.1 Uncharacterised protein [Mycobacteroides abscessus subsp. massiliense]
MIDVEVGRFGLRTFGVDRDGHLLPIGAGDRFDWKDGVCFAECKAGALHRPPGDGCSCGIYSFDSLEVLRNQYNTAWQVVAVIAPEGRARVGGNGTVCERARVIALWTADPRLTRKIREATSEKITPYTDLDQMINDYGLRFTVPEAIEVAPVSPRRAMVEVAAEMVRSAGGIGWAAIVRALCVAVLIWMLVAGARDPLVLQRPEPAPSTALMLDSLDRFLLAMNTSVTPLVVAVLLMQLLIVFVRAVARIPRGGAAAAAGRIFRHSATATLRVLTMPLITVAAYGMLHGVRPPAELVAWLALFLVASSWSSGGALYHVIAAVTARVSRRRPVTGVDQGPTVAELLAAVRRRPRRVRDGEPS